MLSVITPTHNPAHLGELADSLRAQTYTSEWEWVIVPNGAAPASLPGVDLSFRAERGISVRVIPYPAGASLNIGALKRFACEHARGDVVVEADHDDLLTPTAVERLADALGRVNFAYSNFAEFEDATWEPHRYDERYGWRYREREFYGHTFQEARTFSPSAHSLSSINFAPNHARAWRANAYWRIGGHNPDMLVADDHDLCCRFWLDGEMEHIDDLLYLYRLHPGNSYRLLNADVQAAALAVRDHYLYAMALRDAQRRGLDAIDLCSGPTPPEGYTGLDARHGDVPSQLVIQSPSPPVTQSAAKSVPSRQAGMVLRCDLNHRWPFEDSSVGVVRAMDAIEHLRDPIHTISEVWRVLVPGGWFISMTPSTDGRGAFQDPTHVSFWNENSFWYWTHRQYRAFLPCSAGAAGCDQVGFQVARLDTMFPSDWHRANQIPYVRADLVAVKDGYRGPGPLEV